MSQHSSLYTVFAAELPGGKAVVWVGAYLLRSIETPSCVEINGLFVEQNLRSHGIGKLLLAAIEQWGRRVSCGIISVSSNIKRKRTHRFY